MSVGAYPSYKGSGVNWLGSVPSHWTLRRLGYYLGERREKVSDREFPALSVTKNGVVPQLDTAAKTDDGDNRKRVCNGDFVINSRSDRKGSSGLSSLGGSVSLINIVLYPHKPIEMDFIGRLLRSPTFQEEFYRFGKGIVADLWSTNFSEMRNILLAVPPTSEQSAIVSFLDVETGKIDELVAEQERLIALLQEKRQAVISHAVTKGLDPNAPMKDSGVEWLGKIPAHWDVIPLGHLCSAISYGFTNPMPVSDDGPFMLTANDIGDGCIRYKTARRTTDAAFRGMLTAKSKPCFGDILLTKDGTLGRLAVFDGRESCINQSVAFLRLEKQELISFTCAALANGVYQDRMIFEAGGTTIKHIYISRLCKMPIAVPPLNEVEKIAAYNAAELRKAASGHANIERAITLLRERRAALISAAVTGKIDVREHAAAAQAEAA